MLPPGYGFDASAWTLTNLPSLVAWFDPTPQYMTNNGCAVMASASGQFLATTSGNVSLDGAYDWTLTGWFNPSVSTPTVIAIWPTNGFGYNAVNVGYGNLSATVFTDSGYESQSYNGGLSSGSWFHYAVTFDYATTTLKLYLNGSLVATKVVDASGITSGGSNLKIGTDDASSAASDGSHDSIGFYRSNPGDGGSLDPSQVLALYNSGNGVVYADLVASQKVSLVSWYDFQTQTSLLVDSHGNNTLTNTGSVTCGSGIAAGQPAVGDPVYRWYARNNASIYFEQSTLAKRPILKQGANGKYYLQGSGSKFMQSNSGGNTLKTKSTIAVGQRWLSGSVGNNEFLLCYGVETNGQRRGMFHYSVGPTLSFNGYLADVLGSGVLTTDVWKRGAITISAANDVALYLNNTAQGSGTPSLNTYTNDVINLFGNAGGGENPHADVGDVILCSDVLGSSDLALIDSFLSSRAPT